jgi:uncharacterized protein
VITRIIVVSGLVVGSPAVAMNCMPKLTITEQAICNSSELMALDRDYNNLYSEVLARSSANARKTLQREAYEWLITRDKCKADINCLKKAYLRPDYLLRRTDYLLSSDSVTFEKKHINLRQEVVSVKKMENERVRKLINDDLSSLFKTDECRDGGWYETFIGGVYADNRIVSIQWGTDAFCSGNAHGSNFSTCRVYIRKKGQVLKLELDESAAKLLKNAYFEKYERKAESDKNCREAIQQHDFRYVDWCFTAAGFEYAPNLPHVVRACADNVVLTCSFPGNQLHFIPRYQLHLVTRINALSFSFRQVQA